MFDLVFKNGSEAETDSRRVAKAFGKRHSNVMQIIRKLTERDPKFRPRREVEHLKDANNKPVPYYILSKYENMILCLRLKKISSSQFTPTEEIALQTVEQLIGRKLERQFRCGRYRIDGYDRVGNVAYEIDGKYHTIAGHRDNDREREKQIKAELGCEFKRIRIAL